MARCRKFIAGGLLPLLLVAAIDADAALVDTSARQPDTAHFLADLSAAITPQELVTSGYAPTACAAADRCGGPGPSLLPETSRARSMIARHATFAQRLLALRANIPVTFSHPPPPLST